MRFSLARIFALGKTALALILLSAGAAQPAGPPSANNTPTSDEKKAIDLVATSGGKAEIDPRLPADALACLRNSIPQLMASSRG